MGELASVIAAACLTLEYTGSASAVARSWGDKVVEYIRSKDSESILISILDPGLGINPCAFLVSLGSVLLLLEGVKESKSVTNFFSTLKVALVTFIVIMSLILVKKENLTPLVPPEFGAPGILRGATSSFFGYIGFDELCCLSGEAKDPTKNIPRAIILTLIIVTTIYITASLGLAGMVPYEEISSSSGFPNGFRYAGYGWAAEITALGELAVLPIVVLVTIMAQPRLCYAMSVDGLLPKIFTEMDSSGNLREGTFIAGIVMVVIATLVPFTYLDDLISSGILLAFTMTDASVILARQTPPTDVTCYPLEKKVVAFNFLSFVTGLLLREYFSHDTAARWIQIFSILSCAGTFFIAYKIQNHCNWDCNKQIIGTFLTPFVPTLPLLGCFVSLYLIAQLELSGLLAIIGYVGMFVGFYFYQNHKRASSRIDTESMLSMH
jgi:APA family basic amino acid/polyamine antiporter